jgi:hypothetical protein
LKRAIERLLVQPLSNLIATGQVRPGDLIRVDCAGGALSFHREAEGMSPAAMVQYGESALVSAPAATAASASYENSRSQIAKSSRRS